MPELTRAAAIDIGTNTVLLTIAEAGRGAAVRALVERARITRLGQDVDRTRRLNEQARARTLGVLADYAAEIRAANVERDHIALVGTSALRDAEGAESFLDQVEVVVGTRPRVIDGAEEAELTFIGGLSGIDVEGPVVVFDVGGGSTEIVIGEAGQDARRIANGQSLDIGSVRLFERLVEIRVELARLQQAPEARVVGVAGTVTTLAALARGASESLHGAIVTHAEIRSWAEKLAQLSLAERRALTGIESGRADVIPIGAAIVDELLDWAAADSLIASDRGVRWGLLERIFDLNSGSD